MSIVSDRYRSFLDMMIIQQNNVLSQDLSLDLNVALIPVDTTIQDRNQFTDNSGIRYPSKPSSLRSLSKDLSSTLVYSQVCAPYVVPQQLFLADPDVQSLPCNSDFHEDDAEIRPMINDFRISAYTSPSLIDQRKSHVTIPIDAVDVTSTSSAYSVQPLGLKKQPPHLTNN